MLRERTRATFYFSSGPALANALFRPSRPTNHCKNIVFCDRPNILRTYMFSLLTFPFLFFRLSSTLLFFVIFPISAFHLSILSELRLQFFCFLGRVTCWNSKRNFPECYGPLGLEPPTAENEKNHLLRST